MSELPRSWHVTSLGEIGLVQSGVGFPNEAQGLTSGDYPVYKVGDVSRSVLQAKGNLKSANNYVSKETAASLKGYIFPAGSTLFAKIGEALKLNRRAFVIREGLADNNVMGYKAEPGVSDRFVYHYLRTQDLAAFSRSTTVPSIRKGDVEEIIVLLPPADEQTRIAAKLDELLAQVDTLKARIDGIPALLKRFRQSVLAAAVSGRLTEEWRAKNGAQIEEGSAAETSEKFAWPMVRLGDVALDFSYGSSAKSQRAGDIPVLRMGNIQGGRLVWDDLVFSSNPEELKKYSLQVGDVLFNRTNSPELVGKTATYKGEQPAIYAGYLIRVRCSERLISDFLNYCLNSPQGKDYCWQVKTDGVSQSNINAKKLADFQFGLPSTEEQTEIIRCVDQLFSFAERLEARISDARIRIDRLTQSILAKALRGDLVPQDPNDEPADLLLDRIKAQRAAAPKNKRGRRSTTED